MSSAMLLSLFAASVVSSLVPVVNAEALALGSALVAPAGMGLTIALVIAGGQVMGKVVLYRGGRGLGGSTTVGGSRRASEMAERLASRPKLLRWTFFASACTGLPPLYVMAVVAGALRLPVRTFLALCLTGRFLRFYVLVLIPRIL
jgi:membrane protein YqaA with SNARE-associated domain